MNRGIELRVLPVARCVAGSGCLPGIFASAAARWPESVAVEIPPGTGRPERRTVSYRELSRQAERLAESMRGRISAGAVVAIFLPRVTELLFSSQLAVLQAGAAFTCLDPGFPDGQLREILADSEAVAVLTDEAGRRRLLGVGFDAAKIVDARCAADSLPAPGLAGGQPTALNPESLAYIIYTSGTTGRPKGVMIQHDGIANLVRADLEQFALTPRDRVAQSSSPAYDSSIEETWLAFASGAVLVALDDATARLGPDLIPWLQRERITVLCPPPTLLRATGCERPDLELPELRLLYVGGEALPRDVADRWGRGRRLENGYGPTECTVTALRTQILPGEEITIGRPVPGLRAWVLNDALDEVPAGERGELCVGGLGLARGYRHRDDLTAEKFPVHPTFGRIYRTGDLVHRREDGALVYHGRIDSQVKLRGYRVELEAVETRLVECAGVREAACAIQGEGSREILVAYIVPECRDEAPSPEALTAALGQYLPAYMIPAQFYSRETLPRTIGGKVNRRALTGPADTPPAPQQAVVVPRTAMEEKIVAGLRRVFPNSAAISVEEDFFRELGGDSLGAAILISHLRDDPATASLTVRDVYEQRTAAALAVRAGQQAETAVPSPPREHVPIRSSALAAGVQAAWLAKSLMVGSLVAFGLVFGVLPTLAEMLGPVGLVLCGPLLAVAALAAYTPLAVALAVVVKRLLIGRYQAGRFPVWGGFYVRHWVVGKVVRLIPWSLIEGTEFQCAALRALGARIGRRVHLHRGVAILNGGWDLLEIGDDATLGQDVDLQLVELERGHLRVASISIGTGCTLETHAGLAGGTSMAPGAYLAARSALASGLKMPAGQRWDGIPARPAGIAPEPPAISQNGRCLSPLAAAAWSVLTRLGLYLFLAAPLEIGAGLWAWLGGGSGAALAAWLRHPDPGLGGYLWLAAFSTTAVMLTLIMEALACRCLGRIRAGVLSRWSPAYARVWLKAGLVDSAGRWLYGTLFWPIWLRIAGMTVGKGCEISGLIDCTPELTEIGTQSFCADGIYLGGPRHHRGTVSVGAVSLSESTFVGNGAVVRAGQHLPANILIGVCTVTDAAAIRPNTAWFGHPPFELPQREVIECGRELTHSPSNLRYMNRLFWEWLRFFLPVPLVWMGVVWWSVLSTSRGDQTAYSFHLSIVPLVSLGVVAGSVGSVIGLKWLLLGRVQPGSHPLWSCWASRWDFVCMAWSIYAAEAVSALEGTPFLNLLLRTAGVKLGRGVILGGGFAHDLPDPDMLVIEDGATVDCTFQAHTFEDRVLKMDRVIIGRGATVGRNAVLLYGARVGEQTRVAPHSVVMKQEHLLSGHSYSGFPTQVDPETAEARGEEQVAAGLLNPVGFL